MISEYHTTDLCSPCMHKVQLRHEGKMLKETTGALYAGHMFHAIAEALHLYGQWADEASMQWFVCENQAEIYRLKEGDLVREGAPLSQAVRAKREEYQAQVEEWAGYYIERFAGYFSECEWIGTEIPMRVTLADENGEAVECATHADLVLIDRVGQMRVWDWKTGAESPDMPFLGRNLQFGLMYLCVSDGKLMLDKEFEIWAHANKMPVMGWLDVRRFVPYKRGGKAGDRVWKKGDFRPFQTLCRQWTFSPDQEQAIRNEILLRVKLDRLGIYPKNPSITGCLTCECGQFCESYAKDTGP